MHREAAKAAGESLDSPSERERVITLGYPRFLFVPSDMSTVLDPSVGTWASVTSSRSRVTYKDGGRSAPRRSIRGVLNYENRAYEASGELTEGLPWAFGLAVTPWHHPRGLRSNIAP